MHHNLDRWEIQGFGEEAGWFSLNIYLKFMCMKFFCMLGFWKMIYDIKNKFLRPILSTLRTRKNYLIKYFGSTVNDFRGQKFKTKMFASPIWVLFFFSLDHISTFLLLIISQSLGMPGNYLQKTTKFVHMKISQET